MVTTNEPWFCYTNRSETMEFVVKLNTTCNPFAKKLFLYFYYNKIMVHFWKGKIWLRFSIQIFLERYYNDVVIIVLILTKSCYIRYHGEIKRLKVKCKWRCSSGETLNYFACPPPNDFNLFKCCPYRTQGCVSESVERLWDGLDEWEISPPEVLSQSTPAGFAVCFRFTKNNQIIRIIYMEIGRHWFCCVLIQ